MKVLCAVVLMTCMAMLEAIALPSNDDGCPPGGGRIVDESDCGSYFDCVAGEDGTMTRHSRSCFGRAFDPRTLTCTKMSKVKGCRLRQARHYATSQRYNNICKDENVNFACGSCMTQITCSESGAYETQCGPNMRCVMDKNTFKGGVCHFEYDEKCSCGEADEQKVDPYYNGTFFMCDKDSSPEYFECPYKTYFNETLKKCMNYDGSPLCTSEGTFTYPENCSKYYSCTQTTEGLIQKKMVCEANKLYNEFTGECENPCDWPPKKFKCTAEGRFKNPYDCNRFYECITYGDKGIVPIPRSCPPNHHWNDGFKNCTTSYMSSCKISSAGPLEKCERDYLAICEKDPNETPQVEETPQTTNPEEGAEAANVEEPVDQAQPSPPEVPESEVTDQESESQSDTVIAENVDPAPTVDTETEEETSEAAAEETQETAPAGETEESADETPSNPAEEEGASTAVDEESVVSEADQETISESAQESENEVVPETVPAGQPETASEDPEAGLNQPQAELIPVLVENNP